MTRHLPLRNFACKFRLHYVSKPNNSCYNRGPLGYVNALGATRLVHWLILLAPSCLRSHNARYIMLKSLIKIFIVVTNHKLIDRPIKLHLHTELENNPTVPSTLLRINKIGRWTDEWKSIHPVHPNGLYCILFAMKLILVRQNVWNHFLHCIIYQHTYIFLMVSMETEADDIAFCIKKSMP